MHPLVAAEQAKIPDFLKPFVPIEGLIDKAIMALISTRIKNGSWTEAEQQRYDELTMERTRLMRPAHPRFRRR